MKSSGIKITTTLCPIENTTTFGRAELTFPDGQKAEVELFSIHRIGLIVGNPPNEAARLLVDQVLGDERRKLHLAIKDAFEAEHPDFNLNDFHMGILEQHLLREAFEN